MALLISADDFQMQVDLHKDLEETWPLLKQRLLLYLKAAGLNQWPSEKKVTVVLTKTGSEDLQVFSSSQPSHREEHKVEVVVDHYEDNTAPSYAALYQRFLFRNRFQEPLEPFEGFLADLLHRSNFCNFGDQRESLVRDQIILGLRDSRIRQLLLQRDNLTLGETLEVCRWLEQKPVKDSYKQPQLNPDERDGQVKVKSDQELQKEIRQNMGKKLRFSPQVVDNSPRKESFKTYL